MLDVIINTTMRHNYSSYFIIYQTKEIENKANNAQKSFNVIWKTSFTNIEINMVRNKSESFKYPHPTWEDSEM